MTYHTAPGRPPVPCLRETQGRCRICELTDKDGPHYREGYRRLFHPEEFPEVPAAPVGAVTGNLEAAPATAPPPLLSRAAGLGKAIVTHAIAGFPEVDDATHEARLALCHACPHLGAGFTCLKCGCQLSIKTRWRDQHCPVGKW